MASMNCFFNLFCMKLVYEQVKMQGLLSIKYLFRDEYKNVKMSNQVLDLSVLKI